MDNKKALYRYVLRLGDTANVLSQRYCELVGTAPTLEEEIAIANIGLDMIGQTTAWFELAGNWGEARKTADELAFLRDERQYTNYLLAEQENGDFAQVTLRGYLISSFLHILYRELAKSSVLELVAISQKALKEVIYHRQHQKDWLLRLGLGTKESNQRLQNALDELWAYTQEMFLKDEVEETLTKTKQVPDKALLQQEWEKDMTQLFTRIGVKIPQTEHFYSGGTKGLHTEQLGHLLAEMQWLYRAHPGATW